MSDCIPCGCRDNLPMKKLSIEDWKDEYLKLVIYASEVSRENARLRSELESVGTAAYLYGRSDLKAENTKLQELVRDMMRYYFMPSAIDSKQREAELLERARELGVEKDNGELGVEVDK